MNLSELDSLYAVKEIVGLPVPWLFLAINAASLLWMARAHVRFAGELKQSEKTIKRVRRKMERRLLKAQQRADSLGEKGEELAALLRLRRLTWKERILGRIQMPK